LNPTLTPTDEVVVAIMPQSYGFEVVSEKRPKNADGWEYAQRTARQVSELLTAGVPPGSITVVGASKGATIATVASHLLGNPEVNYVLLGTCHPTLVEEWKQAPGGQRSRHTLPALAGMGTPHCEVGKSRMVDERILV